MKLIILGGFLGSGKTTILLQMAEYLKNKKSDSDKNIVIIENEIGEVSIDDQLIRNQGYNVRTMFSGCVCCTMTGDLIVGIRQIQQDLNPDWIILEATGVAYPDNIRENLKGQVSLESCRIFCIADAGRWPRLMHAMHDIMVDQLRGADVIFLNKIDLIKPKEIEPLLSSICEINSTAVCFPICAIDKISEDTWEKAFASGGIKNDL